MPKNPRVHELAKELALWGAAGTKPGGSWYIESLTEKMISGDVWLSAEKTSR